MSRSKRNRPKHEGRKKAEAPVTLPGVMFIDNVENPNFQRGYAESATNPKTISAAYNARESPIAWMLVHERVNAAQAKAASIFRRNYEMAGGAGAKAIDYTKEPVDGGGFPDILTDRQAEAAKELGRARAALGFSGYELVEQVCGQCLWINQIEATKWRQLQAANNLRDCLDVLADFWGVQRRPIRAYRKAG